MKFKLLSAVILTALSATAFSATEQTFSDGLKIKLNEKSTGSDLRIYKDKPVLAIADPDKRKISHNYFDEFNVGKEGMYIGNNKGANTIITEVVSHSPSLLRGNIDIVGKLGTLIIANPNGITCNGCNFSNIADVTLANAGIEKLSSYSGLNLFKNSKGGIHITDADIDTNTQGGSLKKLSLISDNISISRSKINAPEINVELISHDGNNVSWSSLFGSAYLDGGRKFNSSRDANTVKSSLTVNKNTTLKANKINLNLSESLFINKGTLESNHLTIENTIRKDSFHHNPLAVPEMTMLNKGKINSKILNIKTTPSDSSLNDVFTAKSTFVNDGFITGHVNADLNNSTFINNNVIRKNKDIGGSIKLKMRNSEFINNHYIRTSGMTIEHTGDAKLTNNKTIYLSDLIDYSGINPASGEFDSENLKVKNKGKIYKYNSYKNNYSKLDIGN